MTLDRLPNVLSHCFSAAALNAFPVSTPNDFVPLSIVRYSDGEQMLSITGAVTERGDEKEFRAKLGLDQWPFASKTWDDIHQLVVPALTLRERLFLERGVERSTDELIDELGFGTAGEIDIKAFLESYRRYYRFYPTLLSAEL